MPARTSSPAASPATRSSKNSSSSSSRWKRRKRRVCPPSPYPGAPRAAFDIERVTKAFYREFDAHRKAFLKFIEGIDEVADREWYASVMLNRLMFVYFIQRKGFLDGDPITSATGSTAANRRQGKDKFYSFYRYFLLRLFHEGFGKRPRQRAAGPGKTPRQHPVSQRRHFRRA